MGLPSYLNKHPRTSLYTTHTPALNGVWLPLSQATAPAPATEPVAKQAVSRYPPVGASQSNISPAQKTPGSVRTIKRASSASKGTPPAVLIASASGRGATNRNGNDLIAAARRAGSEGSRAGSYGRGESE